MKFSQFVDGKELIAAAKEFATKHHSGQTRKFSGKPYISHPSDVAALVEKYGGTPEMVAAAWLHDVVEDTGVSGGELVEIFGDKVANLVEQVTNPPNLDKSKKSEYIAKKMVNMTPDALTLKLCDRLNNVSDFDTASPKFVSKYAPATKYILDYLENSGLTLTPTQSKIVAAIREKIQPYENT